MEGGLALYGWLNSTLHGSNPAITALQAYVSMPKQTSMCRDKAQSALKPGCLLNPFYQPKLCQPLGDTQRQALMTTQNS